MLPKTLRAWLELARISNLPTVWTNVTAGWLLAGSGHDGWLWLLAGGSLIYVGGMILNDAADAAYDKTFRAERPIPLGRVSERLAWWVGLTLLILGIAVMVCFGGTNFWIALALGLAVIFYDLYHKPWPGAVWVMGACRSLLFLASAWTAWVHTVHLNSYSWDASAEHLHRKLSRNLPELDFFMQGWLIQWALVLGAYIVGLTMVARMEAKGASASRAQSVFARALLYSPGILAAALLFSGGRLKPVFILGDLTPLAPLLLIFAFAAMVTVATRIMKQGGPAIGRAVGILLAGIVLVDALAVSQVSLPLAFGFAALAPLLRLWQRWIAAT